MTPEDNSQKLIGLITEVITDDAERQRWLQLSAELSPDDRAELIEILERQAVELEVVDHQHALELAEMSQRFDREWDDVEQRVGDTATPAAQAEQPTPAQPAPEAESIVATPVPASAPTVETADLSWPTPQQMVTPEPTDQVPPAQPVAPSPAV